MAEENKTNAEDDSTRNVELNGADLEYLDYLIGLEEERLDEELDDLNTTSDPNDPDDQEDRKAIAVAKTEEIPNLRRKLGLMQ